MKLNSLLYSLFFIVIFNSCKKNDQSSDQTQIDVSAQWIIDPVDFIISGPGDGQWRKKIFTSQEQNLFSSLDTVSLTGTTTPDSVIEAPSSYNSVYPNPLYSVHKLTFRFTNGFGGAYILKYVIVDSLMNPLEKMVARMHANITNTVAIMPNIPIGRFRLYYTLSSEANPDFYKCWGNLQKVQ
jgi:hypothetical protein